MASIHLSGVGLAFRDGPPLFTDVELRLERGWTGIVGENGAGKSTLLHLISGDLRPTAGRVDARGLRVVLCPQLADVLTDEISAFALRSDGIASGWRGRLGLRPEDVARWPTLSGGERKRWQLGAALAAEPDALLADEPTNHLDADATDRIRAALAAFRGVGLLVSHDRALLDALTTRTIRIDAGRLTAWPGSFTAAKAAWELAEDAARDARASAAREVRAAHRRLADARRTRDAADAGRSVSKRAKGPKDHDARSMGAKVVAGWAEDRAGRTVGVRRGELERAREALQGHEVPRDLGRAVFVGYAPSRRPWIATVREDAISAGDRVLLRDVDLGLGRTDRVHLAGPNGAGKTTLLRRFAASVGDAPVLVLPQELAPSDVEGMRASVADLPKDVRGRVMALVAALGAEPARVLGSPSPSAGEARKLALALGLGRHVHALLLDEPTNHLDLPSVERMTAALAAFPGAILLVTHDADLAAAVTTTRWELREGAVIR